jgi:hypothetical protein
MTRYAPLWQQAGSYAASLDRSLISTLFPGGGGVGAPAAAVANTMTVSVPPGTLVVPLQSGQGCALCRWDAAEIPPALAAAPPSGQSRVDLVIAQVRDNALDAGGNNDFIFLTVTGTPAASNPGVPATPTNALAVCQVLVPGAVANLNTATFTDRRGGLGAQLAVPAGRAYTTSGGSLLAGWATFAVATVTDLRGGMINNGAGLVVPRPGLYLMSTNVTVNGVASGGTLIGGLYKNGAILVQGSSVEGGTGVAGPAGCATVDTAVLAAGDVILPAVSWNGTGAQPALVGQPATNYLSVTMVSS